MPLAEEAAVADAPAEIAVTVPDNILLADWTGPYDGVPPWDRVKPELFPEAIQFGIDEQRREVLAIADSSEAPTFVNTVEALEKVGQRLDRVLSLFGVMTDNMTTPAYQALEKEWSPKLSAASDEIILNPKLFQRVKTVYEMRGSAGLDTKQQRLVTRLYDSFVRRGANLSAGQKQQLSAYNSQLAGKFAIFGEKVLADESSSISVTEAELKGVPADVRPPRLRRLRSASPRPAVSQCATPVRRSTRSSPTRTIARFARRCGAPSSTAATMAEPTTPTRSSPRSSSCAPTEPGCSVSPATPSSGCRIRWPSPRPRRWT